MSNRFRFLVTVIIATAVILILLCSVTGTGRHKLPPLYHMDGSSLDTSELHDKVILVSYFQTWCSDCVKEQPELLQLKQHFKGSDFEVLMVSDEAESKIEAFREKFPSDLQYFRSGWSLKKQMGIRGYPTTILLDRNRKPVIQKVEGIDWYNDEVVGQIQKLLEE